MKPDIPTCEKNCGWGMAHQPACDARWKAYWRATAQTPFSAEACAVRGCSAQAGPHKHPFPTEAVCGICGRPFDTYHPEALVAGVRSGVAAPCENVASAKKGGPN